MSRPQGQPTGQIDRYYARPLSVDAVGFGFTCPDDFWRKGRELNGSFGQLVVEYELQYLHGQHHRLFNALSVSQVTLALWFDLLEAIDGDESRYLIACCLAENGYDLSEVAATCDDCMIWHDTAEEYARDFVQHEAVEWLEQGAALAEYIDYYMLSRELIRRKILIMISYNLYLVRFNTMDEFIPLCSRV